VHTIRLFLHVLAATVWVGGQLTLAGLVPELRVLSPSAPRSVARRFAQMAWPAYFVLGITGIWNVLAVDAMWTGAYGTTLICKVVVVAISGATAWAHGISRNPTALAVWGAVSGASAVTALFLGVLLHG
jgi:putative copper export protein